LRDNSNYLIVLNFLRNGEKAKQGCPFASINS